MIGAASWFEHLFLGSLATIVAGLTVAASGIAMLTGTTDIRRGVTVILGCFLLFGAPVIAAGIYTALSGATGGAAAEIPPAPQKLPSAPPSTNPFDPYAGAAAPQQR